MKILYVALVFVLVWIGGHVAEYLNYRAIQRAQEQYKKMQDEYRERMSREYGKRK